MAEYKQNRNRNADERTLVEKQLPNDPNAEAAVLSAMLIDTYNVSYTMTWISEKDFYRNSHKTIFKAMKKLFEQSIEIDVVTLTDELKKNNEFDKVGGFEFVNRLTSVVLSGANIKEHVNIIRDKSTLRQLITAANNIIETSYRAEEDVDIILDQAEQQIFNIAENPLKESFGDFRQEIDNTVEAIQEIASKKRSIMGVQSGFIDLDSLMGGFRSGQLVIIAARPAMGKSSFALNMAFNSAVSYDLKIAIFTLEMESQELIMRMLSSAAEIPMQNMLRGSNLGAEKIERIVTVAEVLRDCNIYIDDNGHQTLNQIRARTRRLAAEVGKLDMIIIDYLQLMSSNNPKGRDSRQQEISEISRGLKVLAKEMELPVIALSQLNRQVESRDDKRPILADLRESGAIEQDADVVMFIYRQFVYSKKQEDIGKAEILIRKNRHGKIGTINMTFLSEFTSFRNAEKRSEP
jgi:replicative DNA helicase